MGWERATGAGGGKSECVVGRRDRGSVCVREKRQRRGRVVLRMGWERSGGGQGRVGGGETGVVFAVFDEEQLAEFVCRV